MSTKDNNTITDKMSNKDININVDVNEKNINKDINKNGKIKLKFNNTDIKNKKENEENNISKISENNDELQKENGQIEEKNNDEKQKMNNNNRKINNIDINDSNDSKNFEILNNTSTKKSKGIEIALENFERNQDYDDDDNFNVVMSGTLLKSKNNKPKENIDTDKKEIKSSKNLSLVFANFQESDIEKTKLSKNSDSENNLFSIESKDKLSFIVNNTEKNKNNIIRIKTPNISQKSRSKKKEKNKLNKQNINLKKKK